MAATGILKHIEDQPMFPREDLTPDNAEFLSLVLASPDLLSTWHRSAERVHPIFLVTHEPLIQAAWQFYPESERIRNVNLGIRTLEAIALLVGADAARPDVVVLNGNISGITNPENLDGVRGYFDEAVGVFHDEMPRTTSVIRELSEHRRVQAELAILGGAIARQFGLHNIED